MSNNKNRSRSSVSNSLPRACGSSDECISMYCCRSSTRSSEKRRRAVCRTACDCLAAVELSADATWSRYGATNTRSAPTASCARCSHIARSSASLLADPRSGSFPRAYSTDGEAAVDTHDADGRSRLATFYGAARRAYGFTASPTPVRDRVAVLPAWRY